MNKKCIEEFNRAANSTIKYKQKMNPFGDLTSNQFSAVYTQTLVSEMESIESDADTKNQETIPLVAPLPKAVGKENLFPS